MVAPRSRDRRNYLLVFTLGRSDSRRLAGAARITPTGLGLVDRVGRTVSYRLEDEIVHDLLHWIGARHG